MKIDQYEIKTKETPYGKDLILKRRDGVEIATVAIDIFDGKARAMVWTKEDLDNDDAPSHMIDLV